MNPIIDAHAHLFEEKGYLDKLIQTMDSLGIEKVCLSGLGPLFYCVDNHGIKDAMIKYPTRIIGTYFIRPGHSTVEEIHSAYSDGFRMLKVTIPTKPYDDLSFFSLWEAACDLKMPILFHTGVVTTLRPSVGEKISSWYMHPMRLELIANEFPKLGMIIAHLGVHWNEDAAELLRMRANVYADITGEPQGWRSRVNKRGLDHYLWWPKAFEKLIFGTDVLYFKIPEILAQDRQWYAKFQLDAQTQDLIYYKNITKLLGEK
jgi:predicted TIM-barrel fold metal-dependent hydrolase